MSESLNSNPAPPQELIDGMPEALAPQPTAQQLGEQPVIDHVPGMPPVEQPTEAAQPQPAAPTERALGLPVGLKHGPQLGSIRQAPEAGPNIIDGVPNFDQPNHKG